MGIKWQCVEYARRWLYQNKNLSFGSVNYAYELWDTVHYCYDIKNKKQTPLFNCFNGLSKKAPCLGDLIIYSKDFLQTGHVAVVVEINLDKKYLRVAEQNYHNKIWAFNYSRQINIIINNKNALTYAIDDPWVLGWKSFV